MQPIRLPTAPATYDQGVSQLAMETIRRAFAILPSTPASSGWRMTNVTTDRVLDADATTLAEVADVLATLINDLKNSGHLG